MAELKIVSEVFKIASTIDDVYSFLSDFNRIGMVVNMARQMGGAEQMGKLAEKIEDVQFSEDSCTVQVKDLGEVAVKIVEKEYPKLIKLGGDGQVPFQFNLWIQLLENGPYDTRMRLTFDGEMNLMMKMMLKGKLEKGINQLGEGLAKIPYMLFNKKSES
ncbi:hypothetical protein [Odoribacter laneus]|uniref:hypothetical protein n=1 Tax=Odoribacter laneus TaxID=626933 RepID=UPI003AF71E61